MERTTRLRGWTLVELAVALAIVGILAAVSRSLFSGYQERARTGQAIADVQGIATRIESYRRELGGLPPTLDRAMREVPVDPWGRAYRYLAIEGAPPSAMGQVRKDRNLVPINSDYDLYSHGPDGASRPPLAAAQSQDDIVRANDGGFIGRAADY